MAFPHIGPLEIAIVLLVVLLIFGPKRLPELGRSMGRGMREFKNSITKDHVDEDEEPAAIEAGTPTEAAHNGSVSGDKVKAKSVT